MKNNKYIAALITSVLGVGCIIFFIAFVFKVDKRHAQTFGLALEIANLMVVELIIIFIAGIILLCFKDTRSIGYGVLMGAAITLVIGFGVCTAY